MIIVKNNSLFIKQENKETPISTATSVEKAKVDETAEQIDNAESRLKDEIRASIGDGEVRKLAERSQTAAFGITELTKKSLAVAEDATAKINYVTSGIKETAELIQGIGKECDAQNVEVMQINSGIHQNDLVIQQNASASEELASMAEELSSQTMSLKDTISFFRI